MGTAFRGERPSFLSSFWPVVLPMSKREPTRTLKSLSLSWNHFQEAAVTKVLRAKFIRQSIKFRS